MSKIFLIMTSIVELGLSAMMISGCGSVQRNTGFDEIKDVVEQRSGLDIEDNQETLEVIDEEVNALLKEQLTSETAVQITAGIY